MTATDLFRLTGRPIVIGTGLLALDIVFSADDAMAPQFYAGGACYFELSWLEELSGCAVKRGRGVRVRREGFETVGRTARLGDDKAELQHANCCAAD